MERYKVNLDKNKELIVFADELTQIVDKILELPYGLLSLVQGCIEEKMREPLQERDWEELRAYYFISAVLMTKKVKDLYMTDQDVDKFCKLVFEVSATIAILENVFSGRIEAEFDKDSGEWLYGAVEKEKA